MPVSRNQITNLANYGRPKTADTMRSSALNRGPYLLTGYGKRKSRSCSCQPRRTFCGNWGKRTAWACLLAYSDARTLPADHHRIGTTKTPPKPARRLGWQGKIPYLYNRVYKKFSFGIYSFPAGCTNQRGFSFDRIEKARSPLSRRAFLLLEHNNNQ